MAKQKEQSNEKVASKSTNERSRSSRRSFRIVPMIAIVSVVVIAFSLIGFSKELIRRYQINKDIQGVREEIADLERENQELSYLVDYLNTDAFKEIQARQNLGLQRSGETAVIVDDSDIEASGGKTVTFRTGGEVQEGEVAEESDSVDVEVPEAASQSSSVKAWWTYFFEPRDL